MCCCADSRSLAASQPWRPDGDATMADADGQGGEPHIVVADGPDADLVRAMLAGLGGAGGAGAGAAVPAGAGGAGASSVAGGETALATPSLDLAAIDSTFEVVRPTEGAVCQQEGDTAALQLFTLPGSVWGAFGRTSPARHILVLKEPVDPAQRAAVEVTVAFEPATFGEQAGLWWYASDDDWVKLVVEVRAWCRCIVVLECLTIVEVPWNVFAKQGNKKGDKVVVFARAAAGAEPQVVAKAELSSGPCTLRLEMNPTTKVASAQLRTPAYLRLLGQCDAAHVITSGRPAVAAHGSSADGEPNKAVVTQLQVLGIAANRIEMGGSIATMAEKSVVIASGADA